MADERADGGGFSQIHQMNRHFVTNFGDIKMITAVFRAEAIDQTDYCTGSHQAMREDRAQVDQPG